MRDFQDVRHAERAYTEVLDTEVTSEDAIFEAERAMMVHTDGRSGRRAYFQVLDSHASDSVKAQAKAAYADSLAASQATRDEMAAQAALADEDADTSWGDEDSDTLTSTEGGPEDTA